MNKGDKFVDFIWSNIKHKFKIIWQDLEWESSSKSIADVYKQVFPGVNWQIQFLEMRAIVRLNFGDTKIFIYHVLDSNTDRIIALEESISGKDFSIYEVEV